MGSLESGLSLKRDNSLLGSTRRNSNERHQSPFGQRYSRSRFARFMLFKRIDYLLWICTVAVFLFFVVVFQMFLPGSVIESGNHLKESEFEFPDFLLLKEIQKLDFGEDVKFEHSKLLDKFDKEGRDESNMTVGSRRVLRFGYRKPRLALVFADLLVDPQQVLMVTVAAALREIGYEIEVYALEDGPVRTVWRDMGVAVNIMGSTENRKIIVDWINYEGVLVNSLEAREVISGLLQEPFKSVPLVWTINEATLATRLRKYLSSGPAELMDEWKALFSRATVVVFPNHALSVFYAACDAGNYFVIPGSPAEACLANSSIVVDKNAQRLKLHFEPEDLVITIVGSQLLYRGLWLEQALILQAIFPFLAELPVDDNSNSHLKVIIVTGGTTGNYSVAIEEIALNLGYPKGMVKHISIEEDVDGVLSMSDLVIYGSFMEEQYFPDVLIKSMCFGKIIIAPELPMIKKHIENRVNGYLFPKENIGVLTQTIRLVASKGKLSPLARNVASTGKNTAQNLMVLEAIEGYSSVIENVIKLPSEVASPRSVSEILSAFKMEWRWNSFEGYRGQTHVNRTSRSYKFLDKLENEWNGTRREGYVNNLRKIDETFVYSLWEEQKDIAMERIRKRREEDELKERTDQPMGTWEEVYKSAKRADRSKNDLHEREDGELERTGQPLCIYEPYFGQGAWPFLHHTSLYRGLGLSTKGRRPGADDIDSPSRLPLLNTPYYRDVLGEFGGLFAIANKIDRVHRNAWIGFLSWRATARNASLSKVAEMALLDDIQARKHGDALYFWVRMDKDPRNPLPQNDFWSFCDAVNAGNCKFAFSEAFKKMYGVNEDWNSLPPMPVDGDTWSVMHSWVLPTKSFLEFTMFSRMFVDALDEQMYEEHYQSGRCYLSLSKDKHCYSRVLELLINVWTYHSAKRIMYVDPITGAMQEQHKLKTRRGQMWVKWFNYNTLKSMDEDLAEMADSDNPKRRWLWPSTGEIFWQGMFEKERDQLRKDKAKRKQKSKEKIDRIRKRTNQKSLGKYVKPSSEEMEMMVDNSNSTATRHSFK